MSVYRTPSWKMTDIQVGHTSQKRQCKREGVEESDMSSIPIGSTTEDKFLVETMRAIIARTNLATVDALISSLDKLGLVDTLHDSLVAVLDKPKTSCGHISPELKRKADLWRRRNELVEQDNDLDVIDDEVSFPSH